ncbi:hemerythrin domain-containing protein [Paucibacter soli]|uniref:hemerythrin domain-containing protein n=1 Tax=Paucibacter soli TaxID=3133433 RepID=UPI0030B651AB
MSTLTWRDDLALAHPQIDQTHQEFVGLLNELDAVLPSGADPLPAFQRLLAHTEEHFAMEERWMAATGFAPENCHSKQHAMVLDTLREVRRYAVDLKDMEPMRIIVGELAQWFPAHAEMMDASLVFHMSQVGYDSATGTLAQPLGGEPTAISSCGSSSCG